MNIRVPQSGKAAKIAKSFLKSQGLDITHAQALELVARLQGYSDNQAMQNDVRFQDPLALKADSSNEFEFKGPRNSSIWISVENISVYVKRADEGVIVDLYAKGGEADSSLAGTYLEYNEALSDDEQADAGDSFAASEAIKARYLQSPCSRHDVQDAMNALRESCSDIFPNETAMWEFLMEEAHEDNESEDFTPQVVNWLNVANESDLCALRFDKNRERELTSIDTSMLETLSAGNAVDSSSEYLPVFEYTVAEAGGLAKSATWRDLRDAQEVEAGVIRLKDGRTLQLLAQDCYGGYRVFSPALNEYLDS